MEKIAYIKQKLFAESVSCADFWIDRTSYFLKFSLRTHLPLPDLSTFALSDSFSLAEQIERMGYFKVNVLLAAVTQFNSMSIY